MSFFPDDHPCESLRGLRRPTLEQAKKALLARAIWLEKRIGEHAYRQHEPNFHVRELAAVVLLIELAERLGVERGDG